MKIKPNKTLVSRIATGLLVVAAIAGGAYQITSRDTEVAHAAGASFSFAAVGDHGVDNEPPTVSVFQAMGGKNIDFLQSLGDLAYDPGGTITSGGGAWCTWAKNTMQTANGGTAIPLMLLGGNHEAQDMVTNFSLNDYIAAPSCANPLASQTTYYNNSSSHYAKNYYYDYPAGAPSARIINYSLGLDYGDSTTADYSSGGAYYQWLSDAIDDAKASGLWVIVNTHVPLINENAAAHGSDFTTGNYYAPYRQQATDVFNMLIAKKVDLTLGGHEHDYQRSVQFNTATGCTGVAYNTYNTSCVANAGTTADPYVKNAGLVSIIAGAGGHNPKTIAAGADPDQYYTTTRANGTDYGFLKIDVTATTLTGTYVNASGGSYADSFTITDSVNPTATLTSPTAGATLSGTTTFTATASDNVAVTSVDFYDGTTLLGSDSSSPYTLSVNTTALSDGSHSLTARAHDAAGNSGDSTAVSVTVNNAAPADTTNPTINLTTPTSGATVSGSSLSLGATASDNVGVTSVGFYVGATLISTDTAAPYTATLDTTSLADGSHSLTAVAHDAAGNMATSTAVSVTVNNTAPSDTTSPTVSLTSPVSGATLTGSTTLAASASDNVGVTNVEFYDGTTLLGSDSSSPYTLSVNTTTLSDGSHTLTARAYDAASNSATSTGVTVTVTNAPPVDTTNPTVSLTAPVAGATLSGPATLTATASDNVAVTSVGFYVGATLITTDTTSPYTASLDTTTLVDGSYILTAVAHDAAGNMATSTAMSVTVNNALPADTTSPIVSLTAPISGITLTGSTILVASASDNVAVTNVEFYDGTTLLGSDNSSPYSLGIDTTTLSDGSHTLTARAYDAANNTATSTSVTVTVDNAAPAESFNISNDDGTTTVISLSGACSSLQSSSKPATTPSSLSDLSLVSSFEFVTTCSSAGQSTMVTVDLGARYTVSDLQVFKDQAGGSLREVTSLVTFSEQLVGGVLHTFMNYTVQDGSADDTDGLSNASITDPVYVLTASGTGASAGTTGSGSLASTGTNTMIIIAGALGLIGLSVAALRKQRSAR